VNLLANYWAMEPKAFAEFRARIAALSGRAAEVAAVTGKPFAGPAQDAELDDLPITNQGAVSIVHLAGVMIKDAGWWSWFGGIADTRQVQRAVEAAAADPDIEVIVLRIDSPGGSVDGLSELGDALFKARSIKPVIAQVDGMAASAAYYAASQAGEIRAGRTDLVGSIGTYIALEDSSKFYEQAGLEAVVLKTGEYKGAGIEGTPITPAQRADFQRIVDEYFADFKAAILRGRGLSGEQLAGLADGRVWLSPEARAKGLIDRIATMDETLGELRAAAAERAAGRTRTARAKARAIGRG